MNNLSSSENTAVSPQAPAFHLPIPQSLSTLLPNTHLNQGQQEAIQAVRTLPLDAETETVLAAINAALTALESDLILGDTAVQRAQKFDIYDEFFNVGRSDKNVGQLYIHGLLLTYANALKNMKDVPHTMSVIEIPLLRVAVEATLGLFPIGGVQ